MEDITSDKVLECEKWLSPRPNSFICMPKGVGYTEAMKKCKAFRELMEQMPEDELEEREVNND